MNDEPGLALDWHEPRDRAVVIGDLEDLAALDCPKMTRQPVLELGYSYPFHDHIRP